MDYQSFVDGIKWAKTDYAAMGKSPGTDSVLNPSYKRLRQRGDHYWLQLEEMDEERLGEEIITRFLNTKRWNCHLPGPDKPAGKEMIHNLKNAVDQISMYYAELVGQRIETVEFGNWNILFPMVRIYDEFLNIKPKFGRVPASKLMHMALPDLFVMWDNAIIKNYGVPKDGSKKMSYMAFLILTQENIRHVRETASVRSDMSYQELSRRVNGECTYEGFSLPRLFDVANHAVGHPEKGAPLVKCVRCIERTNERLDALERAPQVADIMKTLKIRRYKV